MDYRSRKVGLLPTFEDQQDLPDARYKKHQVWKEQHRWSLELATGWGDRNGSRTTMSVTQIILAKCLVSIFKEL